MINNSGNNFKYYLQLGKLNIMIPVSLTGFTGYFIFDPHISFKTILVSVGILLMAISASVLNQIQEAELDSLMSRTLNRPVPAGKISSKRALVFFLIIFIAGIAIICIAGNSKAAFIGLFTLLWYNGIYTYSKRITAFAVVPGAVTGALPPLIGFFFTGQIPHFWLLIIKYGEEYKKAGLPSLTTIFNVNQINRLTFTWVVFSIVAALFLCYFEILGNFTLILILLFSSVILTFQFSGLLRQEVNKKNYKKYSVLLDLYFLLVLFLLIIDRIVR